MKFFMAVADVVDRATQWRKVDDAKQLGFLRLGAHLHAVNLAREQSGRVIDLLNGECVVHAAKKTHDASRSLPFRRQAPARAGPHDADSPPLP